MFESFKSRFKNFMDGGIFSGISILPFSKYQKNYSKGDYLSAYEISLYVHRALNIRAQKVGEVEFILKRGDTVIESHELLNLLAKPNKSFSGKEFWNLYQKYMDIFGECYVLADKEIRLGNKSKINELHLLRSDQCTPYFDEKTGELLKVEHNTTKGVQPYSGDQIIYFRNPSPANPLRGGSLLTAGLKQIDTSIQIDEYQAKILENGGKVDGVFNFKTDRLTREQLSDLKRKYQEEYGNASKAGLPLFLSGDATYQKLALNPEELAYLETKKLILDDIVILTGVPKAILGVTSGETFANAESGINIFLRETIKPLLGALVDSLNEKLIPKEFELEFVDPTPENVDEKLKMAEVGIKNYFLTPNEAREMFGIDPIDQGDKLMASSSISPLNTEPQEEQPQDSPKDNKEDEPQEKNKAVKSPACRQANESKAECVSRKIPELIDEGMSQDQAIAVANSVCSQACKIAHPLSFKTTRESYYQICLKRLATRQNKVEKALKQYFKEQRDRIISSLESQKHFRKKDLFDEILILGIEIELARRILLPILNDLMMESAKDTKEISGSDWEVTETAIMLAWLNAKIDIFTRQINETTIKELKKQLAQSLAESETRPQLIERVKETYKGISDKRAALIARTETHAVTQYGSFQGYSQAAMQTKVWVWAPGKKGGVRDWHMAMDGEEKPINTAFSNGQMYPGDPFGGAKENVACECFI